MTAAGLLMSPAAAPAAGAATGSPAPECVEHFQGWRYTDVHNGCGDTVSVTVTYTNGQWAPCRVIEPGGRAAFSGYGTEGNHVTGLRTCDPAAVTTDGP
ncbi:alpha-amylase [Streptomyces sp. NPDC093071]|uniref:alpha-amylase n=1 Tax=Streptomyces sp. NPDC093071 TaxID=3366022 RepID=UPI0038229BCF